MKILHILFLFFLIIYFSCASSRYTISQLKKNEDLYNKLLKKKVLIYKHDNNKVVGYLYNLKEDFITIFITREGEISELKIANKEIKSIKIKKEQNPAIGFGIISILVIIILLGWGTAGAASTGTS